MLTFRSASMHSLMIRPSSWRQERICTLVMWRHFAFLCLFLPRLCFDVASFWVLQDALISSLADFLKRLSLLHEFFCSLVKIVGNFGTLCSRDADDVKKLKSDGVWCAGGATDSSRGNTLAPASFRTRTQRDSLERSEMLIIRKPFNNKVAL